MKQIIKLMVISTILITLAACGFDEEAAKKESKEQLTSLFKVYEDRETISSMEKKELKERVHDSFSDYFTKEYLSNIDNEINKMTDDTNKINFKSPTVFFMEDNSIDDTVKFNRYEFSKENEITANTGDETVKAVLAGSGVPQNMFVEVTMKQEDKKWKIDSVMKK